MALENIDNKKIFLIIGVVLLLLFSLAMMKIFSGNKTVVYSDDPKDWLDKKEDNSEVNLSKATEKISYQNYIGQQFFSDEFDTVFSHDGMYLGNYFRDYYADEEDKVLIRFTQNLSPDNGIPEGFIFERLEENKPIVYILLDEDWKNKIEFTNILWGETYQNSREFVFKEIEKGIYYDKVEDDENRFDGNYSIHYGGILVGRITEEELQEKRETGKILDKAMVLRFT